MKTSDLLHDVPTQEFTFTVVVQDLNDDPIPKLAQRLYRLIDGAIGDDSEADRGNYLYEVTFPVREGQSRESH